MAFSSPLKRITADDPTIRAALEDAVLPPLLPALAHATGELSLLRDELRPDPLLMQEPQGGLTPEQQATIRELAFDAIVKFRDGGSVPAPEPSQTQLLHLMEFAVGVTGMDAYLPLLEEELAAKGDDLRAPRWRAADVAPGVDFRVAIIGAGMSGILAAHRLTQVGIPYVIIEKNSDVGGTWWENTYPGCRVDNPNHLYSYSFAQRDDWPQHFSTQAALLDYFRACADEFGVRPHVRLSTEVCSVTWDDARTVWQLDVRDADGRADTIEANAVISAVGQLNRPKLPDLAGIESFAGTWFHSARWEHDVDLTGKRVAVIGTGASAAQFIPVIAEQVGELTVFQRTPPWMGPTPDYHDAVEEGLRWLYQHLPFYSQWSRFAMFWRMGDAGLPVVTRDPNWDQPIERSISMESEFARDLLTQYFQAEFGDRPDLLAKVVPGYPVGAKRVLRDNGVWAKALKRPNVQLCTDKIDRISPAGVVTADGVEHAFDVIIYGTGFSASKFLTPMKVTGRGGSDLHDQWAGDARAFLGITVPAFPNFFLMYGPNTNIVINGSIIYFSECEARYLVGCLRLVLESQARAIDVKRPAHDAFNEAVDAENKRMAWGISQVSSWYKSDSGRVAQNWPFTLLEYWRRTITPDPADYELIR